MADSRSSRDSIEWLNSAQLPSSRERQVRAVEPPVIVMYRLYPTLTRRSDFSEADSQQIKSARPVTRSPPPWPRSDKSPSINLGPRAKPALPHPPALFHPVALSERSLAFHHELAREIAGEINRETTLDGWPARTPVNASRGASRHPTHDSGTVWFATPSPSGTLTLCSLPVSLRYHRITSSARNPRRLFQTSQMPRSGGFPSRVRHCRRTLHPDNRLTLRL